ncbi:response regulator transcription factor [Chitinophaga pendula]|uniref:response regulator transcription factor n=1 Tax=Chitinophaga TaxID=79328 RepID=UPI000BAFD561|nr:MULTISPECIES: response regulator transcription factor [Chitinophaga]ASZ10731.1 DNA-binding response regulator [Chitinophaga sp. MD30]UCJ06292.1 response regulator transcription factor [Chitinophaga pendula]
MHILIIEDEERIARLVQRGLEESGYQVTVAYDGYTGRKLALQDTYALIITDIILPKVNGIDLCKEIRRARPDQPIIMLTAMGTTDDKVEGFDAGADDYLVKPIDMRELIVRVRALIKRYHGRSEVQPDEGILLYAGITLNRHTKLVMRDGQEIRLTPKEFKLLEYMLLHPERVLSRAEIAENVWNTFDTGTNFINTYIDYLRRKIDRNFATKLIHTRSGMGFIFKEEPDKPSE